MGSPAQLRRGQSITSPGASSASGGGSAGINVRVLITTDATNTTDTIDTSDSMDVVVADSTNSTTTTTNTTNITNTTTATTPWGLDDFLTPPIRITSGDFGLKLHRNSVAAETLKHALSEPARVQEKLQQIVEEAVNAAVHAEQVKEKSRAKAMAKKALK